MKKAFRQFLHYILAAALVLQVPTLSYAKGPTPQLDGVMNLVGHKVLANQYVKAARRSWYRNAELRQRALDKGFANVMAAKSGFLHHMGETAKTFVIIWVICVWAIVKDQIRQAQLKGQSVSEKETAVMVAQAAEHLVNNFEIYAAMVGAGMVGGTTGVIHGVATRNSKIIRSFQQSLKSTAGRRAFSMLLQSGVMSLITFVGWEHGATLWLDSVLLLGEADESDNSPEAAKRVSEDVEIAHNFKFWKAIPQYVSGMGMSERERQVFRKVMGNMVKILVFDHGLRARWFYNTWRKRILKGDFVVLVAAMSSAGAAGGLAPAAIAGTISAMSSSAAAGAVAGSLGGPLVALAFGCVFAVVGGAATLYIPKSYKDKITDYFKDRRVRRNQRNLSWNNNRIGRYIKYFSKDGWKAALAQRTFPVDLDQIFKERGNYREKVIDVWMEQLHDAILQKQLAEFENDLGAAMNDPEIQAQVLKLFEEQKTKGAEAAEQLDEYLAEKSEELDEIEEELFSTIGSLSEVQQGQVEVMTENKELLGSANDYIEESMKELKEFYMDDAMTLGETFFQFKTNPDYQVKPEVETSFVEEIKRITVLHQNMRYFLLGFDRTLAEDFGVPQYAPEKMSEEYEDIANAAKVNLNLYYEMGYDEERIISNLLDTSEVPDHMD